MNLGSDRMGSYIGSTPMNAAGAKWDIVVLCRRNAARIRSNGVIHWIDANECSRGKVVVNGPAQPIKRLIVVSQAKIDQHKLLWRNVAQVFQLGEHLECAFLIAFERVGVT